MAAGNVDELADDVQGDGAVEVPFPAPNARNRLMRWRA